MQPELIFMTSLGQNPVVSSSEHDNESSGTTKSRGIY